MIQDDKIFRERYSKLNAAQKQAVDTIDGPVMVIAGPGTGKTQILTIRIANILKQTDTPPDAILALTFTEAGVQAMRQRLATTIGVAAYRVPIFTFHGFCNEVIGRFSSHFPELVGSRPASALDQITAMRSVFDSSKLEKLASFRSPYHYVKKVLSAVSLLKREGITPDKLSLRLDEELARIQSAPDYIHEKGAHKGKVRGEYLKAEEAVAKNRELVELYRKYEAALADKELYDFDDMILAVLDKLKSNEELQLILQEEYQYLLADEHQDANGAQNEVLELLSSFHDSPNLFIVGDSKQAIYRFQGASLENFLYFKNRFPEAAVINLEENYRSTQSILDAAYKLISDESVRLRAKSSHDDGQVLAREYETPEHEARYLASEISRLLSEEVPAGEIAIFTRTNSELAFYSDLLERAGISISVKMSKDALDDLDVDKLLTLVRAAASVGQDEWLIKALHLSFFNIPELDIYKVMQSASKRKISLWDLLNSSELVAEAGLEDSERLLGVRDNLLDWAKAGANISPAELVSRIAKESGLLGEVVAKPDAEDKLKMISKFISYLNDLIKTDRSLRLQELALLVGLIDEYDVLETELAGGATSRVQMMTAHKSKGLEFDYVFIVGANEGNWSGGRTRTEFKIPGLVSASKEDEEADDRRLFYVALTRARKCLAISWYKHDAGRDTLPSRFIDELPAELIDRQSLSDDAGVLEMAEAISPKLVSERSLEDIKKLVREVLAERGLAVSGLNNYLECPWKYFYRTLLRVPEAQSTPLMFGTAMHAALRAYFDALASSEAMSKETLLKRFERELTKEALTDREAEALLKSGKKALGGYVDWYAGKQETNVKNEFAVDALMHVGDLDLRLTGKLDKMEIMPDGVRVVDYKTGSHKSRNEIEGKTKDSDGNYKRQLVFYKLLLDGYADGLYKMRSGMIDFVEPDEKGRYRQEEFIVEAEEVKELENMVKKSVEEILELSFWDRKCNDEECEYCHLRMLMKA